MTGTGRTCNSQRGACPGEGPAGRGHSSGHRDDELDGSRRDAGSARRWCVRWSSPRRPTPRKGEFRCWPRSGGHTRLPAGRFGQVQDSGRSQDAAGRRGDLSAGGRGTLRDVAACAAGLPACLICQPNTFVPVRRPTGSSSAKCGPCEPRRFAGPRGLCAEACRRAGGDDLQIAVSAMLLPWRWPAKTARTPACVSQSRYRPRRERGMFS